MTDNTFKVNGNQFTTQPTDHSWSQRSSYGISGDAHSVYPALREYEMRWELMNSADFNEILAFYQAIESTGTAVVDLPQWGNPTYGFYSYSGCVLDEPQFSNYFENAYQNVVLVVRNIRT